jgi:hypothetical protein
VKAVRLFIAVTAAAFGLGGCAAVGLTGAAVGAGAFSAGAGAAVQAGKEYTRGGVVYRTFSIPLHELRVALSESLERMELAVVSDDIDGVERHILARARDREIDIRLQPVTRTVTRLRLVVAEGMFRKDRATATEMITQTEQVVEERSAVAAASRRVKTRATPGSAASSLARGGRR